MKGVLKTGLIVVALIAISGNAMAGVITVEAYIDGRSQLNIQGDSAQWYHIDYTAPGREGGVTYPTVLNGIDWFPVWPGDPGDPDNSFCNCYSDTYQGLDPALTDYGTPVALRVIQGRENVFIAQQPDAGNGYELVVEFNDNSSGGADWYIIQLEFATPVPTVSIAGAALLALLIAAGAFLMLRTRFGAS